MDDQTAQSTIAAALRADDGFADIMTRPTAEQDEALLVLKDSTDVVGEDLEYLVWEATGEWPRKGATWADVAELLIAQLGIAQGQIQEGAKLIARLRAKEQRSDR